jgi:hypothetical protein
MHDLGVCLLDKMTKINQKTICVINTHCDTVVWIATISAAANDMWYRVLQNSFAVMKIVVMLLHHSHLYMPLSTWFEKCFAQLHWWLTLNLCVCLHTPLYKFSLYMKERFSLFEQGFIVKFSADLCIRVIIILTKTAKNSKVNSVIR